MTSDAQNNPFIRHLASSDKKVRDQALDSLRTYLSAQSTIADLDLLKLWKGLFYCLWMQDKPALQQALSRDLASLVSSIRTPLVLPFLRAFFATIAREWSHIEALRLDKYLYLIRQYMNASFQFLSRQKWDMKIIEEWNAIMAAVPLNTMDQTIPNGLRYHVLDVWVDEMEKVAGKKWEKEKGSDELEALVQPIEGLKTGAKLKTVKLAARECLADPRLMTWRNMVDEEIEEQEVVDEEEDAEWGGFADE